MLKNWRRLLDLVEHFASPSNEFVAQKIAFDALDGTDQVARAEARRQEAIAAMADATERNLQQQTAARLLKWSIEKFRETKQDPCCPRPPPFSGG